MSWVKSRGIKEGWQKAMRTLVQGMQTTTNLACPRQSNISGRMSSPADRPASVHWKFAGVFSLSINVPWRVTVDRRTSLQGSHFWPQGW